MIDIVTIDSAIVRGLAAFVGHKVIEANTAAKMPPYPFISYEIVDFGEDDDAFPIITYKNNNQINALTVEFTITFNACAKTKVECIQKSSLARDWFIGPGHQILKDAVNVVVVKVEPATNRDVQIGDDWERRFGFDVDFRTMSTLETINYDYFNKVDVQENRRR